MANKYVVRGAQVSCSSGSSPTNINIPKSHGVYVNDKPVLNDHDSSVGTNVMPFGYCKVIKSSCSPALASQWENTQLNTLIKGCPALITPSTLSCSIGGVITIKSDGQ